MPGKSGRKVSKSPSVKSKGAWVALQDDNRYIPSWKSSLEPQESEEMGYIKDGCLYATVIAAEAITAGLDSSVPLRSDSVYLHPDTMKLCGFAIAQPVSLVSPVKQVNIVKPWPSRAVELDQVGCSSAVLFSTKYKPDTLQGVCLCPLSVMPNMVPQLTSITLRSAQSSSVTDNRSFQSYLLIKHEGVLVVEGSVLSIQYLGQELFFTVESFSSNKILELTPPSESLSESFCQMTISSPVHVTLSSSCDGHVTPHMTPGRGYSSGMSSLTPNGAEGDSAEGEESPPALIGQMKIGKIAMSTKIKFLKQDRQDLPVPGSCFSSIGGLKKQIQLLQELVVLPLTDAGILHDSGVSFPHGVLLHGPPGTGKTLLAEAVVGEVSCPYQIVNPSDLLLEGGGAKLLEELISATNGNAPQLIVINDIDYLCTERDSASSYQNWRIVLKLMDLINQDSYPNHTVVIATANKLDSVDSSLRRPCRFDLEIEVPAPSAKERKEILEVLLREMSNSLSDDEVETISSLAHGYVGADLKAVCREAQYNAFRKHLKLKDSTSSDKESVETPPPNLGRVVIELDDVHRGLGVVRPSAMREITVEVPKVLWTDIGGEETIKMRLKESVEWPLKYPQAFSRLGVKPPRGVLLYGPPGCSKTMIARALATESGLNFLSVKGPELFSKWVGDSERAVRQVFSRARVVAPSIIFFDEIDALATHRQGEGSKVGDRVLAQLLTELDGIVELKDVMIVAATNRPDILDKALLRPGRIDRLIHVPLPSPETRREIFQINFSRTPVSEDVSVQELVDWTENYSGAEIVALVQEAALVSMHEDINSQTVSKRHFKEALSVVQPQTDLKTIRFYEEYMGKKNF